MEFDPLTSAERGCGLAHPESYWAATAGPAPDDDGPFAGEAECEVAIIGGGYTGLSCAYHLAREHGIVARVLEANRPGWGCSGRNGGFVRPTLGRLGPRGALARFGLALARELFAEAHEALATARRLIEDGAIDCDRQPDGALEIAHRPSRVAMLATERRILQESFGYPTEWLAAPALAAGHLRGTEAFAALRYPDGFGVHPLKLAYGLQRMARAAGALVHGASPVARLARRDGRHELITPGGTLRARSLVVATNGYTLEALHPTLRGRLLPVLSNIIVTRPMTPTEQAESAFVTSDVMFDTRRLLNYYRRLPDDRVMLGSRGPIGIAPRRLQAHREALLATLRRKVPALSVISADYFWGGWVAVTRDLLPHIHRAEDDPSLHYAMGYCGSGVAAALHAGRRLAERIAGAEHLPAPLAAPLPPLPLAAFRRLGQRLLFAAYRLSDAWL